MMLLLLKHYFVAVPIVDIYIISLSHGVTRRHNESVSHVQLHETYEDGFGCAVVIERTAFIPLLRAYISDTDVTKHLAQANSIETSIRTEDSIVTPVRQILSLFYVTMKPERLYNERSFVCVATADGFDPLTATATISINCT